MSESQRSKFRSEGLDLHATLGENKSGIEGRIYYKHNAAATTASMQQSWKCL